MDVLLVAGLVVAFSFWDPFNFFNVKARVIDTPVSVKSIREIAEFTGAEYYGEVVASIDEEGADTLQANEIKEEFENLFSEINDAVDEIVENRDDYKNDYGGNSIFTIFKRAFKDLRKHAHYDYLYKIFDRSEKKAIKAIARDTSVSLLSYLSQKTLQKRNDYQKHIDQLVNRSANRKELVYIGRGWVKAGFDFQNFSESQFTYHEDQKYIRMRGLIPKILDADINPWFIPEKEIRGFELFKYRGKLDFDDVARVKKLCKTKLIQAAYDRQILEIATKNASEFFQRFFSAIYDTQIDTVIISLPHYALMRYRIMEDGILSESEINELEQEMLKIDQGINYTTFETPEAQQMAFASMMKAINGMISKKPGDFNGKKRWVAVYLTHLEKQIERENELTKIKKDNSQITSDKIIMDG